MKSLMITIKWVNNYGYDESDIKHLSYMKTKDFVLIKKDNEFCSTEDLISNHTDMILNYNGYTEAKLFIGDSYFYNDRMFCKETISFTNFISKVKNYYKNKLKKYKSIKYLEHRRLFGKYPTIKK